MLDLTEANLTQTRFYQEVLQKGEADIILRLLNRQSGALSSAQQDQVRSLPIAHLEPLGEALLNFQGIADLENWLSDNL